MNVDYFVEPSPTIRALQQGGSVVAQLQSAETLRNMATAADRALGLNGALITHMAANPPRFEQVDDMTDEQWSEFINRRANGREWNRWFGKNSGNRYSVVVYS